jgi:hypothetical protein
MKLRLTLFLLLSITLTSCAFRRACIAQDAKRLMIGMTELELIQCAGTPNRQQKFANRKFYTFIGGRDIEHVFDDDDSFDSGFSYSRYCEVTVELIHDLVTKVTYRGRTGGLITADEQCAFVVERCLGREDRGQIFG